jgi:hypothetical protein
MEEAARNSRKKREQAKKDVRSVRRVRWRRRPGRNLRSTVVLEAVRKVLPLKMSKSQSTQARTYEFSR